MTPAALAAEFDYGPKPAVTGPEITKIETLVNEQIGKSHALAPQLMKHEDAIKSGAMALFGEKYGDEVRVMKKIRDQGRRAIEGNEYYLELVDANKKAYFNFKEFHQLILFSFLYLN